MEKPKREATQEDVLLNAKVLRGEILILNNELKELLKTAIKMGGVFSGGVILKRINTDKHPASFHFARVTSCYIFNGDNGPYIRILATPLRIDFLPDKRRKHIGIPQDQIGILWKQY